MFYILYPIRYVNVLNLYKTNEYPSLVLFRSVNLLIGPVMFSFVLGLVICFKIERKTLILDVTCKERFCVCKIKDGGPSILTSSLVKYT